MVLKVFVKTLMRWVGLAKKILKSIISVILSFYCLFSYKMASYGKKQKGSLI